MTYSTKYLIVGGGMTADAACRGIREHDEGGRIVVVGDDPEPPYQRPPLSKALWKGDDESSIWLGTADLGVELVLGRRVVALDLERREARDDRGERYAFEKLLLATGGSPRRLPFGGDGVVYFRTVADFRPLRRVAGDGRSFCVVGGGFIGSEIAAALAMNGCRVTMVFPETGIGERIFPAELAAALNGYYVEHGVDVVPGASVTGLESRGGAWEVALGDGRRLTADGVVAGLGIEPNVELATAVGLPVDNGIVVDELGRVGGRGEVFAAGDVARFPAPALGTALRVEHEDHAKSHGRAVGANMAGAGVPYDHLPFFYSDLFDVGYEAVGETDPRLTVVSDLDELTGEATIAYLDRDRRPRGFVLWNRFGHVEAARELIRAGKPVGDKVAVE